MEWKTSFLGIRNFDLIKAHKNFSAVIPLYFTKPRVAKGAAPNIETHDNDTVSVPKCGFNRKYNPTATPQSMTEKMNCLNNSPKDIDSV